MGLLSYIKRKLARRKARKQYKQQYSRTKQRENPTIRYARIRAYPEWAKNYEETHTKPRQGLRPGMIISCSKTRLWLLMSEGVASEVSPGMYKEHIQQLKLAQ